MSLKSLSIVLYLLLCLLPSAARAATFTVTSLADSGPGSLRAACAGAQASADVSDTITVTAQGTISLTSGELLLSNPNSIPGKSVTINGPGAGALFVSGNRFKGDTTLFTRVFHFSGGLNVALSGMAVIQGIVTTGSQGGAGILQEGGALTLNHCVVEDCFANVMNALGAGIADDGGALALTHCVVTSNLTGLVARSGAGGVGARNGSLSLTDCTVNNNFGTGAGGGVGSTGEALSLTRCVVNSNDAGGGPTIYGYGGGVYSNGGTVMLTDCDIDRNSANDAGDGVYLSGGTATVLGCTLSSNAVGGSLQRTGQFQYYGAGLCIVNATVGVTNCTIASNNGEVGGGIYNDGALTLSSSTVYFNGNGGTSGEGLFTQSGAVSTVTSTILTGNQTFNGESDVFNNGGTVVSGGSNLLGDPDGNGFTNGVNHDQTGITPSSVVRPGLLPLADNGGPTPTLALSVGSPAIDADYAGATPTDQRGGARPQGARRDIGAFEYGATVPSVVSDTFVVTNTDDDGDGSLRRAINNADADPGAHVVFDPTIFGTLRTITLTSGPLVVRQGMTIEGPGRDLLAVSGSDASIVLSVSGSGADNVSGLTVENGNAGQGGGGGVSVSSGFGLTFNMTACTLEGNTAGIGGGLYLASATATLTDCLLTNNSAPGGEGGGLYANIQSFLTLTGCTLSGNSAAQGGGLYDQYGQATLENCTLSGNTATTGGGFYNGAIFSILTNCTVSGNTATTGGGIHDDGLLFLFADTVAANSGGGLEIGSGTADAGGTILAGNTGGANVSGTVTSFGSNLIGDPDGSGFTNGVSNDQTGVADPGLGPLKNNGGPTQTMALLPGSPAIDANFAGLGGNADQRGVTRPQGIRADIGAYEYGFPDAVDDAYTVGENTTLTVGAPGVLANDVADGHTLTGVLQTLPAHGSLLFNSDGSFNYTPDNGFVGTDTFTYQAQGDSSGGGDGMEAQAFDNPPGTATVTLNVTSVPPPTTTASLSGTLGSNGYYRSAVTVTLTATSPSGSEPVTTLYTVLGPGHDGQAQNYTGPFTLTADGIYNLTYASQDAAGRQEPTQTLRVVIDATPPTLTFGSPTPAANANGWNNGTVTIPYTTADATSGVASATPGSPVAFTAEGAHQIQTVTVTDIAGNTAAFTTPPISIDLTPPVTTATAQSAKEGETVTLSATDTLSGVASTVYALDGGPQTPYAAPLTVQTNGTHTVMFHSTDNAGNAETAETLTFTVNVAAPITTAALSGPAGTGGWYTGTVTVTLTAQAKGLPVARTVYTIDGGAQQTYTAPFPVSGDAIHAITYFSADTAGNTEATNQQSVKVDGTPPVTTISLAQVTPNARPHAAGATYTGPVRVTLSATDNLSGVASTTYALDGGAPQAYTAPVTVAAPGPHALTYFSTDVAGNKEATQTAAFTVAPAGAAVLHTFPAGLQLFSVPRDMSGVPLGQALGQGDPKLAVWSPALLQYVLTPDAPADALRPGQGYWARFGLSTALYDLGTPTPTGGPFAVPIRLGWNMIGDPFPAAAPPSGIRLQTPTGVFGLGDDVARTLLSPTTYTYDSGAGVYRAHSLRGEALTPYAGYWLYSRCDGSLLVSTP